MSSTIIFITVMFVIYSRIYFHYLNSKDNVSFLMGKATANNGGCYLLANILLTVIPETNCGVIKSAVRHC